MLDGFVTDIFTVLSQWEELAARGSTRTALKAVLQRRLHGLLVQAAIAHHAAEDEAYGGGAAADQAAAGRRGRRAGRRQAGEASARGAVAKDGCVFIVFSH